jgi:general secretion pathway protein J
MRDPARPRRRGHSDGFTLIELLIALVIFGLILAGLVAGIRFAGRAFEAQQRELERQDDLSAVQTMLRQLIGGGRSFVGDYGTLSFVTKLPRALARGGLYEVRLEAVGDRLVLAWRPHIRNASPPPDFTETELIRGIGGLGLAYYLGGPAGQSGGWRGAVRDAKQPPALIRLVVQFDERDRRHWPPLVIAPMVEAPAGTG